MKRPNNTLLAAIFTICTCCCDTSAAQNKEIPFTQQDRDRLIRLEVKVEAIDKRIDDLNISINARIDDTNVSINARIDNTNVSINARIDKLSTDMQNQFDELRADIRVLQYTFFGGIFILIGSIVGFVLWDRRTTLAPVVKENNSIKQALIDFAEKNSYMKKALKRVAIL